MATLQTRAESRKHTPDLLAAAQEVLGNMIDGGSHGPDGPEPKPGRASPNWCYRGNSTAFEPSDADPGL